MKLLCWKHISCCTDVFPYAFTPRLLHMVDQVWIVMGPFCELIGLLESCYGLMDSQFPSYFMLQRSCQHCQSMFLHSLNCNSVEVCLKPANPCVSYTCKHHLLILQTHTSLCLCCSAFSIFTQ